MNKFNIRGQICVKHFMSLKLFDFKLPQNFQTQPNQNMLIYYFIISREQNIKKEDHILVYI